MFILLIKNIWSNKEYCYPKIYTSFEEAQKEKIKIPQATKHNIIKVRELL